MKSLVNYIEAHPDRPDNPVGDFLGTKEGIEDTIGSISTFIDRFQNQMNIYKKESDMLKSDIEELKNVVSTIPAPKKDLQLRHRFEGVWYSEETDNTLVIKVVNNKIRGCYNYGHNKLIGHYRNTAIVGGILRYEFEWIDKSYAGKGFEKLSKDGKKMSGGWWFSYMNLKYDIAEKHYESVTTPEDLIITKSEFKRRRRKTPKWAEVYFKNIQKSPSYYD
ncbi:MAG: hypothetical protein JSW00_14490 [Thermoplasmata archaeon]|nr:MAG: hypothetical protein JSW00_14490 [Thermoplasmata archaeon]